MRTTTAHRILSRRGWVTLPSPDDARKFLMHLEADGQGRLNGEYITKPERAALACLAGQ